MNSIVGVRSEGRILFMDRLRIALVVLVVFMHSAAAYTNIISWWSVQEMPKSQGLDLFALFVDGFQMPLLFFIAGYFTYDSLSGRSYGEFIVSKFKRIGLPFVAIALFLTPYITYMGIRRTVPSTGEFFQSWLVQMKSLPDFSPVFFTSMEIAKKHWMDYSLWHLWFVMVLLMFYFLYAGFDFTRKRISSTKSTKDGKNTAGFFKALITALVLMTLSYALVNRLIIDWLWGKVGLFSFQPARMPIYMIAFSLGVYAGSRNWFIDQKIPGRTWIWGVSFLVLSVALIACMLSVFITWGQPYPFSFSLLHGLVRAALVIASIAFLSGIMMRLPGRTYILDSMSPYSYEIYIIHLPLVIFFAKIFTLIALPLVLKFLLVGIIVTSASYLLGRYLIKPYPGIACAAIAATFILLCMVYR